MYRKITQEELNEILIKHKKWLNNEEGGERADLLRADLRWANLTGANLEDAIFVKGWKMTKYEDENGK